MPRAEAGEPRCTQVFREVAVLSTTFLLLLEMFSVDLTLLHSASTPATSRFATDPNSRGKTGKASSQVSGLAASNTV